MYHPTQLADQEYLILATFQYNEVFVVFYLSTPSIPTYLSKPKKKKKKKKEKKKDLFFFFLLSILHNFLKRKSVH